MNFTTAAPGIGDPLLATTFSDDVSYRLDHGRGQFENALQHHRNQDQAVQRSRSIV